MHPAHSVALISSRRVPGGAGTRGHTVRPGFRKAGVVTLAIDLWNVFNLGKRSHAHDGARYDLLPELHLIARLLYSQASMLLTQQSDGDNEVLRNQAGKATL